MDRNKGIQERSWSSLVGLQYLCPFDFVFVLSSSSIEIAALYLYSYIVLENQCLWFDLVEGEAKPKQSKASPLQWNRYLDLILRFWLLAL